MNTQQINVTCDHVHKLLSAASGDVALLYLYLQSGNALDGAEAALGMSETRVQCAAAKLRQLGLWEEKKERSLPVGQRPNYEAEDVISAANTDRDFRCMYEEVQRLLGKVLNTEEMKILLGFHRYLGMPTEVIVLLVDYCKERSRRRGSTRNPSLRSIEKEAYAWAEKGIDTLEEASAYRQAQQLRQSRLGKLMDILQIRGRSLTAGEERYAQQWLDWGFDEEALALAYERTCLNTGGLSWAYMNKILSSWQSAGLLTADAVKKGDRKPNTGMKTGQRQLDEDELAAIRRMFEEG